MERRREVGGRGKGWTQTTRSEIFFESRTPKHVTKNSIACQKFTHKQTTTPTWTTCNTQTHAHTCTHYIETGVDTKGILSRLGGGAITTRISGSDISDSIAFHKVHNTNKRVHVTLFWVQKSPSEPLLLPYRKRIGLYDGLRL